MQKQYKVMLLDRSIDKTQFIFDKIDNQLDIFKRAYATEMSIMCEQPLQMFYIDDRQVCVAFTEEFEVLGFATFVVNPIAKYLMVEHVYVAPGYRKQGIFKLMFQRLKKLAKDIEVDKMISFVFDLNHVSKRAHKNLGMRQMITGYTLEVADEDDRKETR